jgi:hypothetical protein
LSDAFAAIWAASLSSREYAAQKASKGLFRKDTVQVGSMRRTRDAVAMSYFLAVSKMAIKSSNERESAITKG